VRGLVFFSFWGGERGSRVFFTKQVILNTLREGGRKDGRGKKEWGKSANGSLYRICVSWEEVVGGGYLLWENLYPIVMGFFRYKAARSFLSFWGISGGFQYIYIF